MNSPQMWNLKRPGIVLPVFFLSLIPLIGQIYWQEASVASLGNTFVTRSGYCNARHNQAGLGRIDVNTVSLQHIRPFILNELGISTLSAQILAGEGAFGATLSSFGILGLRQTSAWISYGMKLQHGITAGLGIHLWSSTIPDKVFFHPGFSFALGIQARINDLIVIGAHVNHPVGWYSDNPGQGNDPMVISIGGSYTFFQTITYYSNLQLFSETQIQSCHGIKLKFKERVELLLGMHNRPISISGGVATIFPNWNLYIAFEYIIDSGPIPSSSFTYAW